MHKKNVDSLYLFAPSFMKNYILDALPTDVRAKVSYIFEGNLYHEHPNVLMERVRVQTEFNHKPEPRGEAKKILDKALRARYA